MFTDLITLSGSTMGTRYAAQFPPNATVNLSGLEQDLSDAVTRVDQQMSPWIPTSATNILNATDVGIWVDVPLQTATVIAKALEIEAKSNAAFSIAVAPYVRHFGFSTAPRSTGPEPLIGQRACDALELNGTQIRKTQPIEIDLCGIAKGYGVDVLAEVMQAHGIADFMVSIDGELRCQGAPVEGQTWQVALENPIPTAREAACIIPCEDLALATSGGYRNFDTTGPQVVTHTINPKTGKPLESITQSVVVAHQHCCDADAWATALMVMSDQEAEMAISENGLHVLFLRHEDGEVLCKEYGNFAAR